MRITRPQERSLPLWWEDVSCRRNTRRWIKRRSSQMRRRRARQSLRQGEVDYL